MIAHEAATENRITRRSLWIRQAHAMAASCPGYVIDHIIALKRGGPDTPANMQWQTVGEAKAKDRVE